MLAFLILTSITCGSCRPWAQAPDDPAPGSYTAATVAVSGGYLTLILDTQDAGTCVPVEDPTCTNPLKPCEVLATVVTDSDSTTLLAVNFNQGAGWEIINPGTFHFFKDLAGDCATSSTVDFAILDLTTGHYEQSYIDWGCQSCTPSD